MHFGTSLLFNQLRNGKLERNKLNLYGHAKVIPLFELAYSLEYDSVAMDIMRYAYTYM